MRTEMQASTAIPLGIRLAARRFRRHRADYFLYLASILEASKGRTTLLTLFERDADRHAGSPRGELCAWWSDRFSATSSLAGAWEGTLPDEELTLVRIAQQSGGDALELALRDMARIAKLRDRVVQGALGTALAGIIGVFIATGMLTLFPLYAGAQLSALYGFIPLPQWGPRGRAFLGLADFVRTWGAWMLLAGLLGGAWLAWSFAHLTGPAREWLDKRFLLYRTVRDLHGAMFLATMATLTRKRGNIMFTLRDALVTFADSARSRWIRWRVQQIVDRVDAGGGVGSDSFDTALLSRDMYHYLRDTQEARGFAEGFEETGRHVESHVLDAVLRQMARLRWVLLGLSVCIVLGVVAWTFSVVHEMKTTLQLFYTAR